MMRYSGGSVPMPTLGQEQDMVEITVMGTVLGTGPLLMSGARVEPFTFKIPRSTLENYEIDADGIAHRKEDV